MERKVFLDNIRWASVWLVVVYHVMYIFNALGVFGGVGPFAEKQPIDEIGAVLYPWFMCLLFLVSGICSRYALRKKTAKQFLGERTRKLLVPSTLGLFVFHWMTGMLNMWVNGMADQIPGFIQYPIAVLSGIGPLWFAQALWVITLVLLLVRLLDKNDRFYALCGKIPVWGMLLLAVPLWGSSFILITPMITIYRFGIYGFSFFLGYFIFAHDTVQEKLEKAAVPLLIAAVAAGVLYIWRFYGENYTDDICLQHPLTNLYLWLMILAILGCSKKWWNRSNAVTDYLARTSFQIYIVHYLPLLAAACLTKEVLGWSALPCYLLTALGAVGGSLLLSELLSRIPLIRWLVFGIKKKKPAKQAEKTA